MVAALAANEIRQHRLGEGPTPAHARRSISGAPAPDLFDDSAIPHPSYSTGRDRPSFSDAAIARHSLRGMRLATAAARRLADARAQRLRARSVSGSMKFEMRIPRRASIAV